MEIKTYDSQEDGTTKVFFSVKDNLVVSVSVGNQIVVLEPGFQFFVDDYVALQIDKCEMYLEGFTAKIKVREGEEIDVPTDADKENEIAELQRKIDKLKGDVAK